MSSRRWWWAIVDGGGVFAQLAELAVESALKDEFSTHLGYDKHERRGSSDGNACNWAGQDGAAQRRAGPHRRAPRPSAPQCGTWRPFMASSRTARRLLLVQVFELVVVGHLGAIEDNVSSFSAHGMAHGDISTARLSFRRCEGGFRHWPRVVGGFRSWWVW